MSEFERLPLSERIPPQADTLSDEARMLAQAFRTEADTEANRALLKRLIGQLTGHKEEVDTAKEARQ